MRRHIMGLLLGLMSAAASLVPSLPAQADGVTLAVAGPMSGDDAAAGQAMLDAARLHAEQVNAAGGLSGKTVRVRTFDTSGGAERMTALARTVAEESEAVAVLGHYYSSNSVVAGDVYAELGLPAITGSATAPRVTEGNDWSFRVIADNNAKGRLSAQYLRSVLERDTVHIVYETDAYGTTLKTALAQAAPEAGLTVGETWGIDSQSSGVDARLDAIAETMAGADESEAIFLGLLNSEAAKLVKRLREHGTEAAILGGDSVGLGAFPETVAGLDRAGRSVAETIDGVHATTYFIADVGNHAARTFVSDFRARYDRAPDALAATYYDAAAVALAAYAQTGMTGDLSEQRAALREALAGFDAPERSVAGVTGRIYFDAEGNAQVSAPFGVYQRGRLISAPGQLTPVTNPEALLDRAAQMESGSIVEIGGQTLYKTAVVYTGIDLNRIETVDQRGGTFDADFYLWFRHRVPLDHTEIVFPNSVDGLRLNAEDALASTETATGFYTAYRVSGRFRHSFDFRDYPFDSQTLEVRLRHRKQTLERLIFVADDSAMRAAGAEADQSAQQSGDSEWSLGSTLVFSDVQETRSTLGNPYLAAGGKDALSYSRFNLQAGLSRDPTNYVLKNLVPLGLFVVLGYCMMFIHPSGPPFVARLSLGVTALLTTVFHSQRAENELPNIGYLVAMDYLYYATYAYFLIGIALTVAEHVALVGERPERYKRLDRFGLFIMPVLMLALIGGAFALHA